MKIEIEIDDQELQKEMTNIIAKKLFADFSYEGNLMKRAIVDAIKQSIYTNKEEIINRVIDRASIEIVRKGLPKLLEKL